MPYYQPKANEHHVGTIDTWRKRQDEFEDELYWDSDTDTCFIAHNSETVSGPNVSLGGWPEQIDDEQLEAILSNNDELRQSLESLRSRNAE